jgi:hypothetical protein
MEKNDFILGTRIAWRTIAIAAVVTSQSENL